MKEQEAKDWLKVLGGTLNNGDKRVEAVEMGIKALEKQIAKKIVINNIPKTSWTKAETKYTCPSCDRVIGFNGLSYCSVCGQRLDWGIEEDWGNEYDRD